MPTAPTYRRKLIEVALPLEAINKESARENYIYKGNPSAIHKWWAQRPLAACRAVLFAQMVDDPSSLSDTFPDEETQQIERQRLFQIVKDLVIWENTTNEEVLHAARTEIARSAARNHAVQLPHNMTQSEVARALKQYAPPLMDPFAGGGSIPLEAQRLGLEAHASDLNPVAVLINKSLIEIPARFSGCPPVNPASRQQYLRREWKGAQGLAEDIEYYGQWIRLQAEQRIGCLYPKVALPNEYGVGEVPVMAWLWARTVRCGNPACGADAPLVRSFQVSSKLTV
jgi:putative DNA methylase